MTPIPNLAYLYPNLTPLLRQGANMLETLSDTPALRSAIGADLRRSVTETPHHFARTNQLVGEMRVELVRNGTAYGLYIADFRPIPHTVRDQWATAVSAPSVDWERTPDGCLVWCEWTEPTA